MGVGFRACGHDQGFPVALDLRRHTGGKRPRYLVDLLFGEYTSISTFEPDKWHEELKRIFMRVDRRRDFVPAGTTRAFRSPWTFGCALIGFTPTPS
jgi:hypothetical protein